MAGTAEQRACFIESILSTPAYSAVVYRSEEGKQIKGDAKNETLRA
jgi:hypothetical protein